MEIDEFSKIGADLFGSSWQTRMARALGVDGSSVRRWLSGKIPVPAVIDAYLRMMQQRQSARGAQLFMAYSIGAPAKIDVMAPENIGRMRKRLQFPGVDQLKPMPSIISVDRPNGPFATIGDEGLDQIEIQEISYELVRHPDSYHLAGYIAAAERTGHQAAAMHIRHHHYSLIAHVDESGANIRHIIATHAGNIRLVKARAGTPDQIIESRLDQIIGADGLPVGEPED